MPWGNSRSLALLGAFWLAPCCSTGLQAQVTLLDPDPHVGRAASVTIGADGLGLIAYYDEANGDLKVAHCSNAACTSATITPLDVAGDVGSDTAITTGADGLGLIAYEDTTATGPPPFARLKVAHCNDLACTSAEFTGLSTAFGGSQAVIGADGLGLIGYVAAVSQAGTASELRHCGDLPCSFVSGGSPLLPGAPAGLTIGADGLALYVYNVRESFGFPSQVVAYHCSTADCSSATTSTLASAPAFGAPVLAGPLAVGADGRGLFPLSTPDGTFMAHCDDTLCSGITLAPSPVGFSLAIGPDGLGLMAYQEELRLGHCDDPACSSQTVSAPIDTNGFYPSLRVGPDGLALVAYAGAQGLKVAHCSLTSCAPGGLALSIGDAGVLEGDSGTQDAALQVSLSAASAAPVSVDWQTSTANGATAAQGVDFVLGSGSVSFAPGELTRTVTASVVGDLAVEPDEFFFIQLQNPSGAVIQDDLGRVTIVDDDAPSLSTNELGHGSTLLGDLAALPGPAADVDYYRLAQPPHSSWEVVVDGLSGDVPPLLLERLAADNATLLQAGASVSGGSSVSLRFENREGFPVTNQHLRLQSAGCGAMCGPSAVYRARAYETTGRIARFNNSATQVSVAVLQNQAGSLVQGALWFWGPNGGLLGSQPFALAAHGTYVLNTATLVPGAAGSISVTHDGGYGALAGKAVALEPATGFAIDTPLTSRPR
jgi:Calx-beta domain